ncbi:MAG: hypothetical protein L3J59_09280 [Methylococcaceae bacterium]|nr:hypothetical protein [Methylococcaceae bacterium]
MRFKKIALLFTVSSIFLIGCSPVKEKRQKVVINKQTIDKEIEVFAYSGTSELTKNKPGSHLVFVTTTKSKKKKLYQLVVANVDSTNPKIIASSSEPIMSPAWSPNGKKIAYVSFENRHSGVFIQTLLTGKRTKVAFFKGINSSPSFSPDGSQLALTLSKDGSPNIYVLNLVDLSLKKVTNIKSIATEPAWSPDGSMIVYTSDQTGTPQLYKVPSTGGKSSRLTFKGNYNAGADFSADGKKIAMVHAKNNAFKIAVMDLASGTINLLTTGKWDESPSFSPDGEKVLYVSGKGNKNLLSTVSVDGKNQQNLTIKSNEVREPAWSP